MRRTILCIVTIVCMLLPAYADELFCSDWARPEIERADANGLIPYYVRLHLTEPIDRKNYTQLMIEVLSTDFRINLDMLSYDGFKDLKPDSPHYSFIAAAVHYGIASGKSSDEFAVNADISRKEAIVMLDRVSKYYSKETSIDKESEAIKNLEADAQYIALDNWAKPAAKNMVAAGLLKGGGIKGYDFDGNISAEQAIALALRYQDRLKTVEQSAFSPEEKQKISALAKLEKLNYIDRNAEQYKVYADKSKRPYVLGVLSDKNMQNALNSLNNIRFAVDLPPVVMDDEYNKKAAVGAFLLYLTNQFTHNPEQKNAPDDIYNQGKIATSKSAIGKGFVLMNDFHLSAIRDVKTKGDLSLAHRRWLLNPNNHKSGVGMAGDYALTYTFDETRDPAYYPEIVAFPSPIAFPADYLAGAPWSIQFGDKYSNKKQIYKIDKKFLPKLTLTRLNDSKSFVFEHPTAGELEKDKNYYNVDYSSFGYGPAIIFRPSEVPKPNERYRVKVENIVECKTGKKTSIEYELVFF